MARVFLTAVLFLSFAMTGNSQMKTPPDVGIDEKLGAQVALDTVLKDENGNDVTLRRLVDKPTILIFNYFRCPGICPVLISNVVGVINQTQLKPGTDFRLIAVSFDPTDTPALAREKKANYLNQLRRPLSPDAWHFLTGTEENTRIEAESAGFNYRPQGDMYVHPGGIIVLTSKGIISRYLYGTSFVPADVTMAVKEAAGGRIIPTISRAIAFCYSYDPASRGYVLNVTRLVGAATLVLVGVFAIFVLRTKSKRKRQRS